MTELFDYLKLMSGRSSEWRLCRAHVSHLSSNVFVAGYGILESIGLTMVPVA